MTRLERLYAITEELRRHAPAPVTADRLAERFGVTRRTVERDLAALREAGVPLRTTDGRGGGHTVAPLSGRAVLTFTASEVAAVLLALNVTTGLPYAEAARSAAHRLADALPSATRVQLDDLASRIRVVAAAERPVDPSTRRTVEEGVRRQVRLRLDYTDRHGVDTVREVDPVGFYGGADGWALVAWCRLRDAGRQFRLDRIRSAHLTTRPCDPHDLEATLGWVPDRGRPVVVGTVG